MQPTGWRPRLPFDIPLKSRQRRRRRRTSTNWAAVKRQQIEGDCRTEMVKIGGLAPNLLAQTPRQPFNLKRTTAPRLIFIIIITFVSLSHLLIHSNNAIQQPPVSPQSNSWRYQQETNKRPLVALDSYAARRLSFPSARLVYAREATATTSLSDLKVASQPNGANASGEERGSLNSKRRRDKIAALHEQLNQLKRQLDAQLHDDQDKGAPDSQNETTSEETFRQLLGSPCLQSADCSKSIEHSHCSASNFTCVCLDQHVPINASTCLPPSLLGYECQIDAQCQQKVAHSLCQAGRCACPTGALVPYRKNKCLAASKIGDYCLSDGQCQLNDQHSFCKWRIQNVYGTCKCPPNYKLIQGPQSSNIRCAPRLGDACQSDAECQLATANSTCLQTSAQLKTAWPTSSASSARCGCAQNFTWSTNQLECELLLEGKSSPSSSVTNQIAPQPIMQESHKYEMIVIPTQASSVSPAPLLDADQLEIKIFQKDVTKTPTSGSTSSTQITIKTTEKPPEEQINATIASSTRKPAAVSKQRLRMSSLGKPCESPFECKARDPHSDCIQGFCQCLVPSARCSANSTGCHRDTFQCRNGQCISWYFVCDHFPNCDDGSDESDCKRHACPKEAFQCQTDGLCVARGKLCDGKRDCLDASDELNCGGAGLQQQSPQVVGVSITTQQQHELSPLNNNNNISSAGTDRYCPQNAFACANGQCLPAYVFCNAVSDCLDGSDEDELLCERPRSMRRWQDLAQQIQITQSGAGGGGQPKETLTAPANPLKAEGGAAHLPKLSPPDNAGGSPTRPSSSPNAVMPNAMPNPLDESPLIKTDRASIERLAAAALALSGRTPESRGRQRAFNVATTPKASGHRRTSKLLTTTLSGLNGGALEAANSAARAAKLLRRPPDECPRWAFTCANGKCRSSAILCSGVDGCGDNSDENRCEVCQCEAPAT